MQPRTKAQLEKRLEILSKARTLISDHANWLQQKMATSRDGTPRLLTSPDAVCFCALGALWAACDMPHDPYKPKHYFYLQETMRVWVWNDTSTHAKVLEGFDDTIAATKRELSGTKV